MRQTITLRMLDQVLYGRFVLDLGLKSSDADEDLLAWLTVQGEANFPEDTIQTLCEQIGLDPDTRVAWIQGDLASPSEEWARSAVNLTAYTTEQVVLDRAYELMLSGTLRGSPGNYPEHLARGKANKEENSDVNR